MGEVDAVVEDGGFAKDHVLCADAISLLGVFTSIEPGEVADSRTVRKVGDDAFLAGAHRETLETEDMSNDLHVGHVARQFVNTIYLRAVHIFIRVVFEQATIGLDAEFGAQHLLAVWAYTRQELNVLIENIQ